MHAINHVRQVEKLTSFCEAFVDDLCIHSSKVSSHVEHLRLTLGALLRRKHKVAATKIFIGYQNIKLLGHYVGNGLVKTDPEKVSAVSKLKSPTNIREVRAFLGIVGFYRRFIRNFAKQSYNMT